MKDHEHHQTHRNPDTPPRRRFDIYTEEAGLPRIKIHDLRHSYVSLLIHKGANLAVIATTTVIRHIATANLAALKKLAPNKDPALLYYSN